MCFRSRSPIRLRHSHHLKLLFLCFSVTLVKPEKPLKVPEVEKFYKLPDSRAVVEFRINTGFTASCFFGTLLVAFAQIKDFYISIRCSATIVSTCHECAIKMHIPWLFVKPWIQKMTQWFLSRPVKTAYCTQIHLPQKKLELIS